MRKKPFDAAKTSVYDTEMPFLPSIVMVDTQLQHATRVGLPSRSIQGEEGRYFNLGDKAGNTEDVFPISHLIESGR